MKNLFTLSILLFGITGFTSIAAQSLESNNGNGIKPDSIIAPSAQPGIEEISVTRFCCLPNDITARVIAPKRDQNNEVCAIIKVVTKDKSLFFEPDALGIIAREDQPGEIWLYVPHGSKRITIKHERFGIIRNYFYTEPIDKATVYELTLNIPEIAAKGTQVIERIVEKKATSQALMMNYSPSTAQVYIDDTLQTTHNGAYTSVFSIGEHRYRVYKPHYAEETGTFDIVPEHPTALNISLQPIYGFLSVKANTDANIFINSKRKGKTPFKADSIRTGSYTIRMERKWYFPQEQTIQIKPTETQDVYFKLKRQKSNVFLLPQISIALNGNQTSYGLFMGMCRKYGGYLNIRTNGNFNISDFDSKDVDNYIYSGKVQKVRHAISGGFMLQATKHLYAYVGAGCSVRQLIWDVALRDNNVYKVAAVDHKGAMGELGIIGRYKHIALSAGFSANADFEYKEVSFGIGYVFGK